MKSLRRTEEMVAKIQEEEGRKRKREYRKTENMSRFFYLVVVRRKSS